MRRSIALLAALALVGPCTITSAQVEPQPSPSAGVAPATPYQADLDAIVEQLPELHADAFHAVSRDRWLAVAADIRQRLPGLEDHQAIVALSQVVAMVGDAHTTLGRGAATADWGYLPVAMGWLAEGPVIYAAADPHTDLLGARIVGVGDLPLDQAADRLARYRASENAWGRRLVIVEALTCIEVLEALGLAPTLDGATLRVVDASGVERDVTLGRVAAGSARMVTLPSADDPRLPVSMRPRPEWQWSERIGEGALYVRYDRCAEQEGRPLGEFFDATLRQIDELDPDRVIIDLRRNGGGNSALLRPFVAGLEERGSKTRPGWVVTLIGPRTFSSASMNAEELRRAGATLVGQPTSQKPNHFGETRHFTLPNCALPVQYSTKHFRRVPGDPDAMHPDVLVQPCIEDLRLARDSALETALTWRPAVEER